MADFRNNGQTIDRKGDKVILTFRDKESGFSVHGKVVMPAHDFNKALMTIGKHRYHISNLQLVYPSAYGDAREYRGEFKPMEIPPATFEVGSSLRTLGEEVTLN